MKILVTSGATREPIDSIRFISNISSGKTGAAIAAKLSSLGATVTLLHGQGATRPHQCFTGHENMRNPTPIEFEAFSSAMDLDERIKRRLSGGNYAMVVHAAAVADYFVASVTQDSDGATIAAHELTGKIDSRGELTIQLARTPKILNRIKEYSCGTCLVVGFKLTHTEKQEARAEAINRIFSSGGVDLVVHNDYGEILNGHHLLRLYSASNGLGEFETPEALASTLYERRFS